MLAALSLDPSSWGGSKLDNDGDRSANVRRVAECGPTMSSEAVRLRFRLSLLGLVHHQCQPRGIERYFRSCVAKQYLNGSKIAGRLVDQGGLCPTKRVGSILFRSQSDCRYPLIDQTCVLSGT